MPLALGKAPKVGYILGFPYQKPTPLFVGNGIAKILASSSSPWSLDYCSVVFLNYMSRLIGQFTMEMWVSSDLSSHLNVFIFSIREVLVSFVQLILFHFLNIYQFLFLSFLKDTCYLQCPQDARK